MSNSKSATKAPKNAPAEGTASSIDLLFESSWEVCNKIGGIYAVLSTKARQLKEQFGDRLIFIGPDVWDEQNPSPYFKEKKSLLKSASSKLELPWGIKIRTGRWDVPGAPEVILVNPGDTASHLDPIYGEMWEKFRVDSLHAYGDYNESCTFSIAAAIVIKAVSDYLKADESKVVAHFDEWQTGMGLLYTRLIMPAAATVFTAHATCIGRSICGNGKTLYQYFDGYNGDQMASELNMQSKHSLEKAAAHAADCFTTVSRVTAREAKQLLDIEPQVVTPNGFEPDFVPKTAKYNKLRKDGRSRLLKVASLLYNENFSDDTFLIATSGRHEYRNKGIDLFLDSLTEMEGKIEDGKQMLAFILVPGWVKEPKGTLLMDLDFEGHDRPEPDYLTHSLFNEDSDEICVRVRDLKAQGKLQKVKVVYVPDYLDGHDGIINIGYYDLLPSFDLTLFPSYYEPWGYTPLESVAFGVPTVTTDKAGFGQWVLDNFKNGLASCGVFVVSREDTNYLESRDRIADAAAAYSRLDALGRSKARNAAFLTAEKANWSYFIRFYDRAFETALKRAAKRISNAEC